MPHLNDSTSKIGDETKKEFLQNIRGAKKSSLRGSSEPKLRKNGQSVVEKMLYENSKVSNTPAIIAQKYNRGNQLSKLRNKKGSRHASESVPLLKKQPFFDVES